MFNVIGTVIFVALASLLPFARWVESLAPDNIRLQIALVHIIFNVVTTLLLLPLARWMEKLACLLVQDKAGLDEPMKLKYFDARLLKTPPIAVAQLYNEVQRMGEIAAENFEAAVECFVTWDEDKAAAVTRREDVLDFLHKEITDALVAVKGLALNEEDTRLAGSLFHVVTDMERVGDHSQNILDSAQMRQREEIKFTPKAVGELEQLAGLVRSQLGEALRLLRTRDADAGVLTRVEAAEQEIDDMTEALRVHHVERLKNRKCSARNGMIYLDILTNLERVGDHAENIATSADVQA